MRPFVFQGHIGGAGGKKDLPENSGLNQVELQCGGMVLQKVLL